MSNDNKKRSTSNNKKTDGKFHSKHISHDPQKESAVSQYSLKDYPYKRDNELS